jgi:hypothetical protein
VVLACSDIFAQDLEDLPEEVRESVIEGEHAEAKPPIQPPQRKSNGSASSPPAHQAPRQASGDVISEPQRKRFYAIAKGAGWADEELKHWLLDEYGFEHSADITRDVYDEICTKVQGGTDAG